MKIQLLAPLFFLLVAVNDARRMGKCELVRALRRANMNGYYGYSLGDWVCMAYQQSRYDTRLVGPATSDGNREYGIFQISSRWWCNNGSGNTANGCHKYCGSFVNDDIYDDIECAKRIVRDPNGMNAWEGWKRYCKGRNLSQYTEGC